MIYLDNTATSWPRPLCVVEAMTDYLQNVGANPGRSGHRLSIEAARIVYGVREQVAALLGAPNPLRIVFCQNATDAINLALSSNLYFVKSTIPNVRILIDLPFINIPE